jgi:hypothetical protein
MPGYLHDRAFEDRVPIPLVLNWIDLSCSPSIAIGLLVLPISPSLCPTHPTHMESPLPESRPRDP